jgi:PHP family Zn ribbon phosphoesterase
MANLFNRLSTKSVDVEQNSSELESEKKINVLDVVKNSNAIHKIQEASQKTKENLSQVDRTTVINKATSLDYDKIIKGVSAVGVFLKPARAISPSLVVLKDAA